MADYNPLFRPGRDITFTATTAVAAGNVVEVTGNRSVGVPTAAGSTKVVGVALYDAAIGDHVTVQSGGVQQLLTSSVVAAGDRVSADGAGGVATSATAPIGTALAAAASGAVAPIKLDH